MNIIPPILATFSKGDVFWVIMLIILLGGAYPVWNMGVRFVGGGLVLWILIALMGWSVFGSPVG